MTLTKQKTIGTGPHVVSLERFIEFYDDKYSLRRKVEAEVSIANFRTAAGKGKTKTPIELRSKGTLMGATLIYDAPPGEKSDRVKGMQHVRDINAARVHAEHEAVEYYGWNEV